MAANDNTHNTSTRAANSALFSLSEILQATKGELVTPRENSHIEIICRGVSTDSRTLQAGSLFIPLKGENFDGHEYLAQAAASGAIAALIEKNSTVDIENVPQSLALIVVESTLDALGALAAFHRRRFDVPVVAVTGSYGKTTTRSLIVAALNADQSTLSRVLLDTNSKSSAHLRQSKRAGL
jgi:UDP-N-acetylmuramoyl-tripeptide--D-alanyl-D-alanine ligase